MFYRSAKIVKRRTRRERFIRAFELTAKSIIMLVLPLAVAIFIGLVWYYLLYLPELHFSLAVENIATSAWIPTFGIVYALFASIVMSSVWGEYKQMRMAVKRRDIETFIDLRDETMSPLVHTLMAVLSLALLGSFMGLNYPSVTSGLVVVTSTAYILALIFFVVDEIDDPCDGLWFIKAIPKEWLEIDPTQHRSKRG